jgi:hypothetical protein
MWRSIGKVIGPPSLLQDTCSFADFILLMGVALTTKLGPAEKALAEERAAPQVAH